MIYLNNVLITPTIFPDKTSQVWKLPGELLADIQDAGYYEVTWDFQSEAEFMHLAQLKHLLEELFPGLSAQLYLPYLPYARQDKDVSNKQTFALHTFSKLLNSLKFSEVIFFDCHSDIAIEQINFSGSLRPKKEILSYIDLLKADTICFPDIGAEQRYDLGHEISRICGNKILASETGLINHYDVIGDAKDKTVLIVDDICDGGMTFILLAKKLKEMHAKEIHLFVSHGPFTKGVQVLKDAGINRIFTKNGEVE